MGVDKATLALDGVAMGRRVADALQGAGCDPVMAIGADVIQLDVLGLPGVPDEHHQHQQRAQHIQMAQLHGFGANQTMFP